jgi:hypothetical protein
MPSHMNVWQEIMGLAVFLIFNPINFSQGGENVIYN